MEISMFGGFLMRMAALALVLVAFIVWWLTNRRISRTDRFSLFVAAIAAGTITTFFSHNTVIGASVFFMAVPWLLTAWTIWLLVARRMSAATRRLGLFAAILLVWGPFTLIRMEGLAGDGNPEMRWRWSRSGEDLFLAERVQSTAKTGELQTPDVSGEALRVQSGDWPGFRGPTYDGVVYGAKIKTDWSTAPPRLVWRQRIGPGWSSVAIVGNRLFTQEQRGESEAVICVDAATGREVWVRQDAARFSENLGGVGPRATPTFADGRIYALGATGILNCLDAATGELKWSHNISDDSGAKIPMWGFSSSPLVISEMVIVFAGGESQQNLLAYRAESGDLVWTAPAGHDSYASAQPASIGGEDQILFFSDAGLTGLDPASGAVLWEYAVVSSNEQRTVQPHLVGGAQVLFSGSNTGTTSLSVTRDSDQWHAAERWASRDLKPFFNDYVIHDGSIYGFDGKIFCCVDSQTGKRRWKQGRYGNGQVLLLGDQPLLLVMSERGEAVLVAANPQQHEELGRFQAVEGKTWNHPVIAHGRLYVRNAQEMACYELGLDEAR
jgi:outer membrane protein assembly factor BamB